MRRSLRRAGPWLPLAVLAVELAFVWFGNMPPQTALVIAAALEVIVWLTLVFRGLLAFRTYQRVRAEGTASWMAAERALSEIAPRKLARIMLYDPRMLVCLTRWIIGKHPSGTPGHFAYHRSRTQIMMVVIALVAIETIGTHLVLLAIFGNQLWIWVLFALDCYAVIWTVGYYASMIVLPHHLGDETLHLHYGFFNDLVVPRSAIRTARVNRRSKTKSGKLTVDGDEGTFCCGGRSVSIGLDPTITLTSRDRPIDTPITNLHVTADEPDALVCALTTTIDTANAAHRPD